MKTRLEQPGMGWEQWEVTWLLQRVPASALCNYSGRVHYKLPLKKWKVPEIPYKPPLRRGDSDGHSTFIGLSRLHHPEFTGCHTQPTLDCQKVLSENSVVTPSLPSTSPKFQKGASWKPRNSPKLQALKSVEGRSTVKSTLSKKNKNTFMIFLGGPVQSKSIFPRLRALY